MLYLHFFLQSEVGCVIVNTHGDIVGRGFHPKAGLLSSTTPPGIVTPQCHYHPLVLHAGEPHAEIFALRDAGLTVINKKKGEKSAKKWTLSGDVESLR